MDREADLFLRFVRQIREAVASFAARPRGRTAPDVMPGDRLTRARPPRERIQPVHEGPCEWLRSRTDPTGARPGRDERGRCTWSKDSCTCTAQP